MKKKILFVRPTLGYGGADRVTLNLLKGFDREAYTCDLALMRAEGEFIPDIPQDVKVFDLKANSLWSMWQPLKRLLKTSDYDILYSTCGGASMPMMLAVLLAKYRGVTVVSERNILFPPNKSKLKRRLMLLLKSVLYKRATWVTAVSKGVAEECIQGLGLSHARVVVVNNPIINEDLVLGKDEILENTFFQKFDQIMLSIGRFEWQKDYDTLLEAFEKVAQINTNVGLFILGKGPLAAHYKAKIAAMGLQERIELGGFDKNPFKYLSACDVYVLSSRHEGMPGVLIQAMACGTACVATDCPTGPNELIIHEVNGLLVPVGDVEGMAEAMLKILHDKALRTRFAQHAPASVLRFHADKAITSYFNFLG
ncbi:MAG: hypothetical protein COW03_09450 [Cytophagales bacterium CG12_big_fil_rev_8_21_14_0_65_40_12]|nr:MAG: hypothetical protein COW03_09450 [Cytophagales bacterium CG12_big_fil_rev_8_21_14_0_65_40_12]PIW05539.1 MAG: hypothetical protein COW40_03570 [Cytophagales bacterium CG17_big_fil_post_rev_8_21_14_2_50_40_13]